MKTDDALYSDSFFNGIKRSVESSFITPFALFLQAGSSELAMISSSPKLVASFFQLFTPQILQVFKRRRSVIIAATIIDACMYLPIMLIPLLWDGSINLLLNFLVIQSMAIAVIRPLYGGLIGDVLPQSRRASVLGQMNLIASVSIFGASLFMGLLLDGFADRIKGFMLIFSIAMMARLCASFYRWRIKDEDEPYHQRVSLSLFVRSLWKHNFSRFVLYNAFIKMTVGMSAPFVVVYLIEYLGLDFIWYSVLLGVPVISSYFVLSRFGRKIDHGGSKALLNKTGYFISVIPLLWVLIPYVPGLIFVRILSGVLWSGFNLAVSNFIIDATTKQNRLSLTSYAHFFEGIAFFLGAMLGAAIMGYHGASRQGFVALFSIVSGLRLVFSIIFLPRLHEERLIRIRLRSPKAKRIVNSSAQGIEYVYVPRNR